MNRPEEAKQTALTAARGFMEAGHYDRSVAWLYHYCVTRGLGAGQEKEALAICAAYLAGIEKTYWEGRDSWVGIVAKREELLARQAGKPVPGLGYLRLLKGAQAFSSRGREMRWIRMVAAEGKLWLAAADLRTSGYGFVYDPARDEVSKLQDIGFSGFGVNGVAATRDSVYFAGNLGLYRFDTNGVLRKHYDQKQAAMPGNRILNVCEGGGKIYFSFQGSPTQGVAVLDPASDRISVLAPSGHDAKRENEPLSNVSRMRWDAATPRVYAYCYQYQAVCDYPLLTNEYSWTPRARTWHAYPIREAPRLTVSQGDDAVVVRPSGEKSEFEFVKTGQKVTAAVPAAEMMGEPAWDENRIWAPTSSGLYEIDRASSNVQWLAYQEGNPFYSVLKVDGRLYIATARGLYGCENQ